MTSILAIVYLMDIVGRITTFFAIFTPTQFFLTALAGFKAGNMIVEQPKINIILDKTYKILENKLDELLVESDKKIEQGDVK